MTIKRIVSLIMAALMVFSVFTMTAVAESECIHHYINEKQVGYTVLDFGSYHLVKTIYSGVCVKCNESGSYTVNEQVQHSHSRQDLINQYHSGEYHYYTYYYKCECGNSFTRTDPEYCGNPCGGIHLSVPDENI